ncbi:signal peptide peptidase-domain-containing protein [Pseudoneurospora amorphoporcata]|uniref:Signal peptide peptidase-domain-containing protein n=1 Tax=Pseudoneurospora amorphoporcata TaxID=241081 RepID=A0AAN6NQE9_9PEZI|nr:signal peptide peptidase-domain-containing protein [Pseudoneurospora amorphoporcata]
MAPPDATAVNATGTTPTTVPDTKPYTFHWDMFLRPEVLLFDAQVIFGALTIIWLGAHGSIRRPPSAGPAESEDKDKKKKSKEDEQFTEGLTASDAIMFPILAGAVLIGLYYLLEWLKDPDLLNKILRGYMSIAGIAGLGKLSGDALEIITSFIFPSVWSDRSNRLYYVDPERRSQVLVDPTTDQAMITEKKSPFPGIVSSVPLPTGINRLSWEIRHLFTEKWTVRLAAHGFGSFKSQIKFNHILGFLVSIAITTAYHLMEWHVLSNILGSAMCYAAFGMLSPTSFGIGSAVLWGLFFYDIVMVFYTPFMITVAKKVDAPIKLVFKSSSGFSMLGLGDIVVPGLLMALALRFDLYMFYKRQIQYQPIDISPKQTLSTDKAVTTTTEMQFRRTKTPFVESEGQWGNRFWTTKLGNLMPNPACGAVRAATAFPKPYFYASVTGYALGMVLTLTMLQVFNHGQPALLYLVPCVTGSVWLTGLVRRELKDVWGYTEDGSLDTKDVVVTLDANGDEVRKSVADKDEKESKDGAKSEKEAEKKEEETSGEYDVVLFSIKAPRPRPLKTD